MRRHKLEFLGWLRYALKREHLGQFLLPLHRLLHFPASLFWRTSPRKQGCHEGSCRFCSCDSFSGPQSTRCLRAQLEVKPTLQALSSGLARTSSENVLFPLGDFSKSQRSLPHSWCPVKHGPCFFSIEVPGPGRRNHRCLVTRSSHTHGGS